VHHDGRSYGHRAEVTSEWVRSGDALAPLYYHPARRLAGNSLRLVCEESGAPLKPPAIIHGSRPDWYPAPSTRAQGVRRLLLTQQLGLADFASRPRRLGFHEAGTTKWKDSIADVLTNVFHGLGETGAPIWLALTGGFDSRTLLAAALRAGAPVHCFTFAFGKVSSDEAAVAAKVSAVAGVPHRTIRPGELNRDALALYRWWGAEQKGGADADMFAMGCWSALPEHAIVIRGLGFEFARDFYRFPDTAFRTGSSLYKAMARPWVVPMQRDFPAMFDEWLRWVQASPEPTMRMNDRLYLEQRIGAWCATNEESLMLVRRPIFHPGAVMPCLNEMNGVELDARRDGAWQIALIEMLAPELLSVEWSPRPTGTRRLFRFAHGLAQGSGRLISHRVRHWRQRSNAAGLGT
jgi:hypothetical protein